MKDFTFVTGNEKKAKYLSKLLGLPVKRHNVDIEELQTTDIRKLVTHKAEQAFAIIKSPVLVEDQSLGFNALDGLPGPFIRQFIEAEDGLEMCCKMLDGFNDRSAEAKSIFAYYDGSEIVLFSSSLKGEIPSRPRGEREFGWDQIFIPEGETRTRAELTEAEDHKVYLKIKPINQVREFLISD